MADVRARLSRWWAPWKPRGYVTLRNVSDHNIVLHLPTGRQRIDRGRTLLVTPEVAHHPEVQKYMQDGLLVSEEHSD